MYAIRSYYAIAADVPDELLGDEPRLRQILFNLVGNALKFTESGTVRLSVSSPPLGVSRTGTAARLTFIVEDTGIGVPEEKLSYNFV